MKHQQQKLLGFCMVLLFCVLRAQAQDTLHLTLPAAEKLFFEKNLSLLAEKYNLDIARAQIAQARLYANPALQVEGNIYNPQLHKGFDIGNRTGQYTLGVQQLILLAGKRNKQVKMAETGLVLAGNDFYELLRTLLFELRSSFYQAYFLQKAMDAYQVQISALEKLNATYEVLLSKDAVTLKDAVRIRSLLYSLMAERASFQNQFNDQEGTLQLLLQDNHTWFIPRSDINRFTPSPLDRFPLQQLLDTAYTSRQDLRRAQNSVLLSEQHYALQKAMATPDLTAGVNFDKRGSFVDNATFFTLAIDLPFFNRNQGAIKAARLSIDQHKLLETRQVQTVENEVQRAYLKVLNADKMLLAMAPEFKDQAEFLLKSITLNFEKGNIGLLELTDFYDSYKENILRLNQLQNERVQSIEALNFAIGKYMINF